jgi:hypothetical protein
VSRLDALRPYVMGVGTYVNALEDQDQTRIRLMFLWKTLLGELPVCARVGSSGHLQRRTIHHPRSHAGSGDDGFMPKQRSTLR